MTLRCVIGVLWEAIAEGWAIAVMAADSSGWSTALEYSSRIFPQEIVLVAVGSGLEGLSASSVKCRRPGHVDREQRTKQQKQETKKLLGRQGIELTRRNTRAHLLLPTVSFEYQLLPGQSI
jgi:hypothetical protein